MVSWTQRRLPHGLIYAMGGDVREVLGDWVGGIAKNSIKDELPITHAVKKYLDVISKGS